MSRADVIRLAREGMGALPLYAPELAKCTVDLSDNTNLWGAPPAALRALHEAPVASLSRYPTLYSEPLRDALLEYVGLASESEIGVVTGCGSDDVLDSTMRAFGGTGDAIAFSAPTFSMIPVLARLNGLTPHAIPFADSFDLDAERLVDAGAKITYLCAPNNPTATPVSRAAVEYVAANAAGIVLIDEVHMRSSRPMYSPTSLRETSASSLHARSQRRLDLRACGLAMGWARSSGRPTHRTRTWAVQGQHPRRARGSRRARAHGGWSRMGAQTRSAFAIENRSRLIAELSKMNFGALPSAANFVMVPTPRAAELFRALASRGVLVRAFTAMPRDLPVLAECNGTALRIGVGPWEMMEVLLATLCEVMA